MAYVNYEPWFGVRQLQDDINRLFTSWSTNDSSGVTADWTPTVDINEYDEKFQLFVDVPGVDPKDVEITLEAGVLTISGGRYRQAEREGEKVIARRSERGSGKFYRKRDPVKPAAYLCQIGCIIIINSEVIINSKSSFNK